MNWVTVGDRLLRDRLRRLSLSTPPDEYAEIAEAITSGKIDANAGYSRTGAYGLITESLVFPISDGLQRCLPLGRAATVDVRNGFRAVFDALLHQKVQLFVSPNWPSTASAQQTAASGVSQASLITRAIEKCVFGDLVSTAILFGGLGLTREIAKEIVEAVPAPTLTQNMRLVDQIGDVIADIDRAENAAVIEDAIATNTSTHRRTRRVL